MPKIDGYDNPAGQRADVRQVTRATAERSTATPATAGTATTADTLQITAEAQRLREGESRLRELPATDTERVARIRAAIADGSYQIDTTRVAHKLMAFDAGLPDG
jgi:negative regulator of flagellin synthesis FlgM